VSTPISRLGSTDFAPVILQGQHKLYVRSHDGLRWIIEPNTHDGFGPHHAEQEPFGNSVHDYIMGLIEPGSVFLDIGAHVGHYTLRAAKKGAKVLAVEANPATSARLLENIALNRLKNVTLLAMAAWDHRTVVHLAHGASEEVRSGGMRVLEEDTGTGISVPALPLDCLLLGRIDVVKIDTEGADIHILRGLHDTIAMHKPVLVVENHSYLGYYQEEELHREELALTDLAGYRWHDIAEFGVQSLAGAKGLNYRIGLAHG
jgi:FkbM family methyltransferase